MASILTAIYNIVNKPTSEIKAIYQGRNRANSVGDALEAYVKDIFAGTYDEENNEKRKAIYHEVFSYFGNQNNPPDLMIKNGDAIEVKKLESITNSIALNSSYPKDKLFANNPMLTSACRVAEAWEVKDLIYIVGCVPNDILKSIWLVYGDCYAAEKEIYERIKDKIGKGINEITDVEFSKTKELGRVNKVDPLGITNLRIRGMWQIENPSKVFKELYQSNSESSFEMVCIMKEHKYLSFSKREREVVEKLSIEGFNMQDVKICNPNNPSNLVNAKLITYNRE